MDLPIRPRPPKPYAKYSFNGFTNYWQVYRKRSNGVPYDFYAAATLDEALRKFYAKTAHRNQN